MTSSPEQPLQFPLAIAAIDVGGTKIGGAVLVYDDLDSKPTVHLETAVPTNADEGGAAVLSRIEALVEQLCSDSPAPIRAIGVGTAGRVDAKSGCISYANEIMPGWTGQPVGPRLRERFGLPVSVLGDVQAHALGEARWGAAHGAANCVVVAAGTGLGGAIIANGSLLRGAHGFAGELGHVIHPAASGIACACGASGHLESVASGSGIEYCFEQRCGKRLSSKEISNLASEGNPCARAVIEQAGRSLGESIACWSSMLDPEMVIVSGSVSLAGPLWEQALHEGFRSQTPESLQKLPIVSAKLGHLAPLFGAAEYAFDHLKG